MTKLHDLRTERRYATEFTLKQGHLDLMKRMFVDWKDCEFGAPAIDCKRPYGNSNVVEDIAEILLPALELDPEEEVPGVVYDMALQWHADMETALQIVLCTQGFRLGRYRRKDQYDNLSWEYMGND